MKVRGFVRQTGRLLVFVLSKNGFVHFAPSSRAFEPPCRREHAPASNIHISHLLSVQLI